jgi:ribonuclease BN (tRNA processing enzyme)
LLNEHLFPVRLPCEYCPLEGSVALAQNGQLETFPLIHPGGSLGMRLNWPGRSMAYVTDTTADPTADYVEQLRNVDLLIHECNFTDEQSELAEMTGHSSLSAVAQVAAKAGVRRCVLVHLNPLDQNAVPSGFEQARAIFPELHVGHDEQVWEF